MIDTQHSELLHEIHRELKTLTQKVESAFVKDDDGEVDYSGHKQYHKKQNESEAEYSKHRARVLREVVTWIVIGILSVVGTSLVKQYLFVPGVTH